VPGKSKEWTGSSNFIMILWKHLVLVILWRLWTRLLLHTPKFWGSGRLFALRQYQLCSPTSENYEYRAKIWTRRDRHKSVPSFWASTFTRASPSPGGNLAGNGGFELSDHEIRIPVNMSLWVLPACVWAPPVTSRREWLVDRAPLLLRTDQVSPTRLFKQVLEGRD